MAGERPARYLNPLKCDEKVDSGERRRDFAERLVLPNLPDAALLFSGRPNI